jgi:hypothetical protein
MEQKQEGSRMKHTDFDNDQITTLRDNVYQLADSYQGLKELQATVKSPDLARLVNDLREIYDGSLSHYLEAL